MILTLGKEYSEAIDKIVKPELYKAFGNLIVEMQKDPDDKAEEFIKQTVNRTKIDLMDSLSKGFFLGLERKL